MSPPPPPPMLPLPLQASSLTSPSSSLHSPTSKKIQSSKQTYKLKTKTKKTKTKTKSKTKVNSPSTTSSSDSDSAYPFEDADSDDNNPQNLQIQVPTPTTRRLSVPTSSNDKHKAHSLRSSLTHLLSPATSSPSHAHTQSYTTMKSGNSVKSKVAVSPSNSIKTKHTSKSLSLSHSPTTISNNNEFKASDVFFLDAGSLRNLKLGPSNAGSNSYEHSLPRSIPRDKLVEQAGFIEDLVSIAHDDDDDDDDNDNDDDATSITTTSTKNKSNKNKQQIKTLKRSLVKTKDETKRGYKLIMKIQRDIDIAEVLQGELNREVIHNKSNNSGGVGVLFTVNSDNSTATSNENLILTFHRAEIKAVASLLGITTAHTSRLFSSVTKIKSEGYSDGFIVDLHGLLTSNVNFNVNVNVGQGQGQGQHGRLTVEFVRSVLEGFKGDVSGFEAGRVLNSSSSSSSTTSDDDKNVISLSKLMNMLLSLRFKHNLCVMSYGSYPTFPPPPPIPSLPPLKQPIAKPNYNTSATNTNQAVLQLRLDLLTSSQTIHSIDRSIARDVAIVSQHYNTDNHTNVKHFSITLGTTKLVQILSKTRLDSLRIGMFKFRRFTVYVNEIVGVRRFLKVTTSRVLTRSLVSYLVNTKIKSRFTRWKVYSETQRYLEHMAAAVCIQSVARMKLASEYVKVVRFNLSATGIQRRIRGVFGREKAERRRVYLFHKAQVRTIECFYANAKAVKRARAITNDIRRDNAAVVIQSKQRRIQCTARVHALRVHNLRERCCLMIQCLHRGYSCRCFLIVRKENVIKGKKCVVIQCLVRRIIAGAVLNAMRSERASACHIQRCMRGWLGRLEVKAMRRRVKAVVIQRFARAFLARAECQRRRHTKRMKTDRNVRMVVRIQCLFRLHIARVTLRLKRVERVVKIDRSVVTIQRLTRGVNSRVISSNLRAVRSEENARFERQMRAANVIQKRVRTINREAVAKKEQLAQEVKRTNQATIKIQSIQRARASRQGYLKTVAIQRAIEEKEKEGLSEYYLLQRDYLRSQGEVHGRRVRMIQTAFRSFRARNIVIRLRREKEVERVKGLEFSMVVKLQCRMRQIRARKHVKEVRKVDEEAAVLRQAQVDEMKVAQEGKQTTASVRIQSLVRTITAYKRVELMKVVKQVKEDKLKKAIAEKIAHDLKVEEQRVAVELEEARVQSALSLLRVNAVVLMQAQVRAFITRIKVTFIYNGLRRDKEQRAANLANQAAVTIQCRARCRQATKITLARLLEVNADNLKKAEDSALEQSLVKLHKEQELLLYVLRMQNAVRMKQAKNVYRAYMDERSKAKEVKREVDRVNGAVSIQAALRGVKGRRWYNANYPRLKKALVSRSWCVECMEEIATRKCTTCLDRYCVECWGVIHGRGRKRMHAWDVILYNPQESYNSSSANGNGGGSSSSNAGNNQIESGAEYSESGNSEWVEYFDQEAQSKYFYNTITNEASWVRPY